MNLDNRIIRLTTLIILFLSCDKKNDEVYNGVFSKKGQLATIITTAPFAITDTSAIAGGNLTETGNSYVTSHGVCWGISQDPEISGSKTVDGNEPGEFTSNITGLQRGKTYYMRAYVTNTIGTAYGDQESFTTLDIPTITTATMSSVTDTTATSGGNVTSDGGAVVTVHGICWSTIHNPTVADSLTKDGPGLGVFSSILNHLVPGTTYYIKAYATNIVGTGYGGEVTIITSSVASGLPVLTTTEATLITQTTATSGGDITSNGGKPVTTSGICWYTSPDPVATGNHTTDGTVAGTFTSPITGLTENTTYYVRAYATNSAGTAYGNNVSFTTKSSTLVIPTISTAAITGVTQNTAICGGNITSDGGATVTASGVCWSTSANPVETGDHTTDGAVSGTYTSSITGLTAATTYYLRAYATNSVGTAYGGEVSFTTAAEGGSGIIFNPGLTYGSVSDIDGNTYKTIQIGTQTWMAENLKTTRYRDGVSISNITDNSAWSNLTSGAYCWFDNDQATYQAMYGAWYNYYAAVDNRNLCPSGWHVPNDAEWTTLTTYLGGSSIAGGKLKETGLSHWLSPNVGATNESGFTSLPGGYRNFDGTFGSSGGGTSAFWGSTEYTATNAGSKIMYYYDSKIYNNYAYKAEGCNVRCLKDEEVALPVLTTTAANSITQTTATSGGNITSDGGASVTARGVCWSTSANPTITSSKTTDGAGVGSFVSSITGLTSATTYYIRAYATNSIGTTYGAQLSFTTLSLAVDCGIVTDADGNIYNTVTIGTQCWFKENLRTSSYRDGSTILKIIDDGDWSLLTSGAYCWYNNDQTTYRDTYGALYNYYAVETRELCPTGWHVPDDAEWTILTTFLGGENVAGGKLKEAGTIHWISSTIEDNNETGFTALPGGYRFNSGPYDQIGSYGHWWSSTEQSAYDAWDRNMGYAYSGIGRNHNNKLSGFSIRCLQGEAAPIVIGDYYKGGIIIYIYQPGDLGYIAGETHGLTAATSDQSTGIQWYNGSFTATGATETALGTGNSNTNLIVSIQGPGSYAAKICYDLVLNGYNDWYLPSKYELDKLYKNKALVGGFGDGYYWSSSENDTGNAWIIYFFDGIQSSVGKSGTGFVRAIRTF